MVNLGEHFQLRQLDASPYHGDFNLRLNPLGRPEPSLASLGLQDFQAGMMPTLAATISTFDWILVAGLSYLWQT